MENINKDQIQEYISTFANMAIEYAPKLLLAIIVLVVGLWVINLINRGIRKALSLRNIDPSLAPFMTTLISWTLRVMLFISIFSMIGVQMTSFVAIVGAAGLAVGLSLQGTLQNMAGGVILLLLRPFKVGDTVDAKGYLGIIHEIQIFYTIMHTFDKKVIYIPNGALANADMTNISQQNERRNEWTFGIAYGDDYDKAKSVLLQIIDQEDRILREPEPFIAMSSLGDSSVNIVVRTWSTADDLWPVYFDMNEKVYKEFAKAGLTIPFPQMDVHVHQNK